MFTSGYLLTDSRNLRSIPPVNISCQGGENSRRVAESEPAEFSGRYTTALVCECRSSSTIEDSVFSVTITIGPNLLTITRSKYCPQNDQEHYCFSDVPRNPPLLTSHLHFRGFLLRRVTLRRDFRSPLPRPNHSSVSRGCSLLRNVFLLQIRLPN